MLSVFKILIMYHFMKGCYKITFFIKTCIILMLLLFINSSLNSAEIIFKSDMIKNGFNINNYARDIFPSVIAINFTLGILKDFHMDEIIPFLNLPIKKGLFLTLSISKFYFDFSFSVLLLLFLSLVSLISRLTSIDLTIWIGSAIFYSLIFQQIGFLIRILKISFHIKIVILIMFVSGLFLIIRQSLNHEALFFFSNKIYLLLCGGTMCLWILHLTKKYLCKNLIDYL
jgi:hypothetical protein